jgi:hypothetical protein
MVQRRRWVLWAYVGLSLVLTWPLAAHLAGYVPGDGIDNPALAWNLWWLKHALVDQLQNPFACAWMFWPVGINLAFYTLTVLNGLLSIPLQVVLGIVPAYNVLLLSSFALGGYGAFLLACECLGKMGRRERPDTIGIAAFVGGALYAFASAKMFYAALGQGNIASSQWAPFAALYIVRTLRPRGRPRDAALAALFLVLQAYAEQTYASFLLIFAALTVVWALAALVLRPGGSIRRVASAAVPFILRLALMGALCLIGLIPFLANMLPDLAAEGDFFSSGGGFADVFSADLAGYALPTQLHPLLGGLARAWSAAAHFPVDKGQQIYIGYTALVLAVIGLLAWRYQGRAGRESRWIVGGPFLWAAASMLFFLLTLGPSLRMAGHDLGVPLPFALVARLPFFKGNRYPSRYSVMLLLSLAPLVAAGVWRLMAWAAQRWSHRTAPARAASFAMMIPIYGLPALVLALMLFEHLSVPLPLSRMDVPALYDRVTATPGDFALLELPGGWRNGARVAGKMDPIIMAEQWYQTVYGKRLLGGNTSRNPAFKFQYFSEDPTLAILIALVNAADVPQHSALRAELAAHPITPIERDRAQAWASFLNIRYVMVHRDKAPAEAEVALKALLPVTLVDTAGPLALYALPAGLPRPTDFAVGDDQGRMALAEGWSPPMGDAGAETPVWATRTTGRLLLPLGTAATQIRLEAWAAMPGQTVALTVDGHALASQPLSAARGWVAFDVPADLARPALSDVRVQFSRLVAVAQAAVDGPWPVGQTGVSSPVSVLARSAGEETGAFAHLYVNGQDVARGERGYNLAALDPADGRVLASAVFDTFADAAASERLAAWVRELPEGAIVAGAVSDEASTNLGQPAVDVLQAVGVRGDLRGHFRWGHAFIGIKGAGPDTALEAIDGVRPAQVYIGLPADAPMVAAALARVVVGPQ